MISPLTARTEWKPGYMTLCEAFDYACDLFNAHIAELTAQLRAKGFDVSTAEAHAAVVGKKAEFLEQLFAPFFETKH